MTSIISTDPSQVVLKRVYRTFFSPSRYEVKPTEQEIVDWGDNYRINYDVGELAVTSWGSNGPAVLLMHGWGGARAQMTGFVDPLLFAGYRVVAFDQPGHGESTGTMTNLLEIAPTMDLIAQREGPFHSAGPFLRNVDHFVRACRTEFPAARTTRLFRRVQSIVGVAAALSDSSGPLR